MSLEGNSNNSEPSKIEDIKKSLYSRSSPDVRMKRRLRFREKIFDVKPNWDKSLDAELESGGVSPVELNDHYEDHTMSFFTKLLIGSVIFFVIAAGLGAYIVLNGSNIVSANNVDIEVNGPVSVAGGEVLPLDIQVTNKNNIKLEVVDLSVDFPAGTANPDDATKELKTFRETIDDIEPGGIDQKTVRAIVFGEENSKKTINVKVEYRVKGSNAIFLKEKAYEILVTSSPISLTVTSFKEVTSGQEFDVTVVLTSNSTDVLKNLVLKGVYPFGFSFISSNVKPVGDNMTWRIGDLPPKSKKTITIHGKLDGQDDEDRVFRFNAGAASTKNDKIIGTQYIASSNTITIKKPFISVNVALDDDSLSQEYTGHFNAPIRASVAWFNNLQTPVIDAEIHVKLSGTAYDKVSVSPDQGFYQSSTNEIIWNKVTTRDLASIAAGGSGRVTFTITPRDPATAGKPVVNPDVSLVVDVRGKRNSESNVPESIVTSASRHIRIASNIALSTGVVRSIGPFTNTGPIPPVADKQTTYTVIMTVYNSSSNVSNAQVTTSLPAYVKWAGKTDPSSEDIRYNSVDGQILWNIGNVPAYTGSGATKKAVAFQVTFEPGVNQVGQTPTLVNRSTITATDSYTGDSLTGAADEMTINFTGDPAFHDGDSVVK